MTIVVDAKLPKTVEELREDPLAVREGPLDATIELKDTSAPGLLAVFGRDQITAGTMTGKIHVTGTIASPIVKAHVVASNLVSRPGSRGRRIPTVKQLALDATYDSHGGKATLVGEEDSGGKLNVTAELSPKHLSDRARS